MAAILGVIDSEVLMVALYIFAACVLLWLATCVVAYLWCTLGDPPLGVVVLLLFWPVCLFRGVGRQMNTGSPDDELVSDHSGSG